MYYLSLHCHTLYDTVSHGMTTSKSLGFLRLSEWGLCDVREFCYIRHNPMLFHGAVGIRWYINPSGGAEAPLSVST